MLERNQRKKCSGIKLAVTGGYWRLPVAKRYSEIWIHCLKEISDGNAVAIKLAATGGYRRLLAAIGGYLK